MECASALLISAGGMDPRVAVETASSIIQRVARAEAKIKPTLSPSRWHYFRLSQSSMVAVPVARLAIQVKSTDVIGRGVAATAPHVLAAPAVPETIVEAFGS